jgi:hypothetical protein
VYRGWVELDVKAILDALQDCGLVDIVVASVDDTDSLGPAPLGCADGCP